MLLDTQYRMHPDIADLPSSLFYNSKLLSGVSPAERPLPKVCVLHLACSGFLPTMKHDVL